MKEVETLGNVFLDFINNQEYYDNKIYYDCNYISDGVVAFIRGAIPVIDSLLEEKAKYYGPSIITDYIMQKGKYCGNFEILYKYRGCIYHRDIKIADIPVDEQKDWYVDSRWIDRFDNSFEIDEVKIYEYFAQGKQGCILEFIGWIDKDDYYSQSSPRVLGYVMGSMYEGLYNQIQKKVKERMKI